MRTVVDEKLIGEEATVIHTEVIEILVARLHPDEVPGSRLTLETGSVVLPDSADVVQVLSGVQKFVDVEVFLRMLKLASSDAAIQTQLYIMAIELSRAQFGLKFQITSMISDQNCQTLGLFATYHIQFEIVPLLA